MSTAPQSQLLATTSQTHACRLMHHQPLQSINPSPANQKTAGMTGHVDDRARHSCADWPRRGSWKSHDQSFQLSPVGGRYTTDLDAEFGNFRSPLHAKVDLHIRALALESCHIVRLCGMRLLLIPAQVHLTPQFLHPHMRFPSASHIIPQALQESAPMPTILTCASRLQATSSLKARQSQGQCQ